MSFYNEKQFSIISKDFYRSEIRIRELALRKIVTMDVKHAALFEALGVCPSASLSHVAHRNDFLAKSRQRRPFFVADKKEGGVWGKASYINKLPRTFNISDNFKMVDQFC